MGDGTVNYFILTGASKGIGGISEKLQEKHEFVRLYFQLYQGKSSL